MLPIPEDSPIESRIILKMRLNQSTYFALMDYLFKSHPSLFLTFYDSINLDSPDEKGEGTLTVHQSPNIKEEDQKRLLQIITDWYTFTHPKPPSV